MDIVNRVLDIVAEYEHVPLTIRQIFYRLVGKYQYEKTEQSYGRLVEYISRARRAGIIEFDAIRDDGDIVPSEPGFAGISDFWDLVDALAEDYFVRPECDVYPEIWVEAAGMVPQIQQVANQFGVRVIAGGGFSSITARHNAARRLIGVGDIGKRSAVLLIGDHDPSGGSIMDCLAEDVIAFGADQVEFARLAVTLDQARQYALPSAPQKTTDRRGTHMAETWQCEALDPTVLAGIVESALIDLVGHDALVVAERQTEQERKEIVSELRKIRQRKKK